MNLYDLVVKDGEGKDLSLSTFKGKVLIIVNTATGCGFTPQYEALEALYEKYHDQGLEILDFPCNQFGNQAPGTNEEIKQFCTFHYNTKFPQLDKVEVNGKDESPVFTYLKSFPLEEETTTAKNKMVMKGITKISKTYEKENDIKWNFTKFLLDRKGNVIKRYSPIENPNIMEDDIVSLLK